MAETEEKLLRELDEALRNTTTANRLDLSDYVALRANNDLIREEAVKWLYDTAVEIAEAFNARGANIGVERLDPHRFLGCGSNLSGSALKLRHGLRCLTVEAGWTKSTRDGIMRGGALVCARITHKGFKRHDEELVLLRYEMSPQWFAVAGDRDRVTFSARSFKPHFEVFLG